VYLGDSDPEKLRTLTREQLMDRVKMQMLFGSFLRALYNIKGTNPAENKTQPNLLPDVEVK